MRDQAAGSWVTPHWSGFPGRRHRVFLLGLSLWLAMLSASYLLVTMIVWALTRLF